MKKRRIISAIIQWVFLIFGNTFGIWFTYFVIKLILDGIIKNLKWPGINFFIENGSFLVITFSILTSIILTTTARKKINFYNGFASVLLILTTFVYIRCIGLNGEHFNLLLGTIPFLLSIILLFFALINQRSLFRKYSWFQGAKNHTFYYDIFLSFAIAGNEDKEQRDYIEEKVSQLDDLFKKCGYPSIFNASKYFNYKHEKQDPAEAAKEDFAGIENSKNFVLFYPDKVPSSALMELGYALRDKRNILIISRNQHSLPFLARGMAEVNENVRTIYFEKDFEDCLEMIKSNHESYFEK
jgi:hypothetical protein